MIFGMHYTILNDKLANTYLKKLINAQKRGVKVFLIIDDLMSDPNKELIRKLKQNKAKIIKNKKKKYDSRFTDFK